MHYVVNKHSRCVLPLLIYFVWHLSSEIKWININTTNTQVTAEPWIC